MEKNNPAEDKIESLGILDRPQPLNRSAGGEFFDFSASRTIPRSHDQLKIYIPPHLMKPFR